ncbi:MAG TPA: 50S ribosomal protein L32 [Dehalococcoidia bacterium]|nr:50S ribosomal protein L32 [Dehalococcoidia bacterium]HLB29269.1 50S ribosomal protein L32 [Dehalococcoidia bacterium]
MPPLPKKKHSKARQGKRRSHLALAPLQLVGCPQCHKPRLPHRVCPHCGHYRGREVLPLEQPRR